ncbi:MAG TPA: SDR family oxidoreductase [Herpetosiphonaceae bacterium]
MQTPILVTGASGNVGREIVKLLSEGGFAVRAADRRVAQPEAEPMSNVEAIAFDFNKPETFAPALAGVERMFLMRPPAIANVRRFIFPAIDAAKQAGVQHIVFLSLIGVEKNRIVPHYKIEQHILASGLDYTFLRASFFMQNLNTAHRREIRERSEIFVPAGKGKTSFIDVRDIAAVAALALTQAGHAGQAYDLTGGEALDYDQVAQLFSQALSRPIIYRRPSLLRFLHRQHESGVPWSMALVLAGIYTTARLGLAGRLAEDTRRLLGRAPIRLKDYIDDYKAAWA